MTSHRNSGAINFNVFALFHSLWASFSRLSFFSSLLWWAAGATMSLLVRYIILLFYYNHNFFGFGWCFSPRNLAISLLIYIGEETSRRKWILDFRKTIKWETVCLIVETGRNGWCKNANPIDHRFKPQSRTQPNRKWEWEKEIFCFFVNSYNDKFWMEIRRSMRLSTSTHFITYTRHWTLGFSLFSSIRTDEHSTLLYN